MNTPTTNRASWLIIGLGVLPLMPASAGTQTSPPDEERLEWLLATHDVRYVMHASLRARGDSSGCSEAEHSR